MVGEQNRSCFSQHTIRCQKLELRVHGAPSVYSLGFCPPQAWLAGTVPRTALGLLLVVPTCSRRRCRRAYTGAGLADGTTPGEAVVKQAGTSGVPRAVRPLLLLRCNDGGGGILLLALKTSAFVFFWTSYSKSWMAICIYYEKCLF